MKQLVLFLFFGLLTLITVNAQSDCGNCDETKYQKKEFVSKGAAEKPKFTLYPNPATDFIGLSTIKGVQKMAVYNLVGREMKTFKVTQDMMYYVGDLPMGVYLVQLIGPNKKIITTQRINKK